MNTTQHNASPSSPRLLRRGDDRMLAGVCGGIAEYFGVDATIVRLAMVIATVLGIGAPVLAYLACWLLIPERF
ncbi:MAG: PspC domain-containing protein [Sciscionella sp.]|nr:PspC domain-containing protein [Sciscionella sp.]